MSLFSTLNTATSGLGVSGHNLSVIGDNVANMNTTGFKASRAEFADLLPNQVSGIAGPSFIGTGANLNTVSVMFGQGSLEASDNALDLACAGDGFFIVSDGVQDYYTRNGEFFLDEEGYITNAENYRVQGYFAGNGVLGGTVDDLQLELDPIEPQETTEVNLAAIVSAEAVYSTTPFASGSFDMTSGTGDTLEDIAAAADFATSVTIYDSLGQSHELTVVFERTDEDTWSYYAMVDAGEVTDSSAATPPSYDEGAAFLIASGDLSFDADGVITSFTQTNASSSTAWNFYGADGSNDIDFILGVDALGDSNDGNVRMLAGASSSSAVSQDGYPTGTLTAISVGTDGQITGSYSNGEALILGMVVLAQFPSNHGLERVGGTLYKQTPDSGDPAVGEPDTGGRGKIVGNALEAANVELEDEFIKMIRAQRSYQSNSRVVEMTDNILNELVQLI